MNFNRKRLFEFLQQVNIANLALIYFLFKSRRLCSILKLLTRQLVSTRPPRPLHLETALHLIDEHAYDRPVPLEQPIDIILPVYNGYDFLVTLLDKVFDNTHSDFRLIVVDDASTDQRIWPFLESVKANQPDKVLLLKNSANQGFVKSVNRAYLCTKNHFVLLNTDVEVPPHWLERLVRPIIQDAAIASTTPFTNAGNICGFPHMGDNPLFENLSVEKIDSFFRQVSPGSYPDVPTGVGFCMGINRGAAEKIGMFDDAGFSKGYGEENDWSRRAKQMGYKNVMVPNLYVFHKHGGSFEQAEKKRLLDANFRRLIRRYPDYLSDVYEFTLADPLKPIRDLMILLITGNTGTSKPVLIIESDDHGKIGNDNQQKRLILNFNSHDHIYLLSYRYKSFKIDMRFNTLGTLEALSERIRIEDVIVKDIHRFPKQDQINAVVQRMRN